MIDSVKTIAKRDTNRRRLNGGAERNSIRLGLLAEYSTIVNIAAKIATSTTICALSDPIVGNIADGVTIISTTSAARAKAPGSREVTAFLPSIRPDAIRCRVLVPF